jgi:hypothetical protein
MFDVNLKRFSLFLALYASKRETTFVRKGAQIASLPNRILMKAAYVPIATEAMKRKNWRG